MNESANGTARPADDGERIRRRQYRITARLLKEYTARMSQISTHLGDYLEGRVPRTKGGGPPWSVISAVWWFRSTWEEVRATALFASQMLVHYRLDEAEAAELKLRVAEAEWAIHHAGHALNSAVASDPEILGDLIPREKLDGKPLDHAIPRLK